MDAKGCKGHFIPINSLKDSKGFIAEGNEVYIAMVILAVYVNNKGAIVYVALLFFFVFALGKIR